MFERIISAKIMLEAAECYCGIQDLYETIAKKIGYTSKNLTYDCTKICVSPMIQEQIFTYYKFEKHLSEEEAGMNWVLYGPKANLPYDNEFIVEIQRGFIKKV